MTVKFPELDNAVEEHIRSLPWSSDASNETITLVAGNIRGVVCKLLDRRLVVPMELITGNWGDD